MIQAYRQTHNGQTPSPQLVRSIITSNATDLQIPSQEQGAGELNALADVQAAESVNSSKPVGTGRLISPNQLDFAQQPGQRRERRRCASPTWARAPRPTPPALQDIRQHNAV